MPDIIVSAVHVFIYLVLTTALLGRYYYYPPFIDEKLKLGWVVTWQVAFSKDGCHSIS